MYAKWKFTTDETYNLIAGFDPDAQAKTSALEFLTGFVIEKSLAIDNIFIFAVVFGYFAIPKMYQHRVLFWGILGALVFRAIFIGMGSVLMQYEWVVIFFGVLLIITGIKMFFAGTEQKDLDQNIIVRGLKRVLRIHPKIVGQKFFTKINGLIYVTPLFLALVFLELTDIIFAVDSVPAIFAITKEPLIVFTSNIFAMLGLRSMYFFLANMLEKFSYLEYSLIAILTFVGIKMLIIHHYKFPEWVSLGFIALALLGGILVSLSKAKDEEKEA